MWPDAKEGLLHQLASLGSALGEAFHYGRTFILPANRFCLPKQHANSSTVAAAREQCVDMPDLLDLQLMAQHGMPTRPPTPLPPFNATPIDNAIAHAPCNSSNALVRRDTGNDYWFAVGYWTDCKALRRALSAGDEPPFASKAIAKDRHVCSSVLKSGIYFTPRVKAAAAAIVAHLGELYMAVHLRRGDRNTSPTTNNLTKVGALADFMHSSFPPGATVYIGSTEPLRYFAPLIDAAHFRLFFATNFSSTLEAHGITNNLLLFAVELLVFYGSAKYVETLEGQVVNFFRSCFPATQAGRGNTSCSEADAMRGASACTTVSEGVRYGGACASRLGCSLVPLRGSMPPGCSLNRAL